MSDGAVRSEWVTYSQAREITNLGRTTLSQLVSRGEVKAVRVGRAVRLNRASLDDYLERNSYVGARRENVNGA